jgi:periplasmic protein TonB
MITRLRAFLLISVAMHATALTYRVVFPGYRVEETVSVVVLSVDDETGAGVRGDGQPEGKAGKPAGTRRIPSHAASVRQNEQRSAEEKKEQSTESKKPSAISLSLTDIPAGIPVEPAMPSAKGTSGSVLIQEANGSGGGGAGGVGGGASSGKGLSGTGSGSGAGRGDGGGESRFVQASYAYAPKPEYPAPARREGKEGRVLLRVLVDEQGKSKSVEVDDSSGSEALDRAAAEAIKRWRFSPARYGNKSVESWVKIPIDFRLTDAQN